MRSRIAEIRPYGRTNMSAAVERNDARVMNHFIGDGDRSGCLDDPGVRVVDGGEGRAGKAAADAALPQAEVLWTVENRGGVERTVGAERALQPLPTGTPISGHRWNPA